MTNVLRRDTRRRGGSDVTTEAETGVSKPKGNKYLQPPGARKRRVDSPLEPSKEAEPCQCLDFRHLTSGAWRESVV